MPAPQSQSRLKNLIKHIPLPALVIHLKKGTIVCNNRAAVEQHGAVVACGKEISFPEAPSDECRIALVSSEGGLAFAIGDEGSPFEFTPQTSTLATIIETQASPKGSPSAIDEISPDLANYPSFHFSYLHKVLTDKRTYPDPSLLKRLNLVETSEAAENLSWRALIIPEDREDYDKTITQAVDHGGNHRMRYRVRSRDGQIHELTDFFSVIHEEGMWPVLSGTIVSSEGSTHKMQQVERLCLVGRLVGGMIHDFRNLLGGVQNMLEWCMAQSPEGGPVYKAMNKTINYTDQANGLIRCTLRLLDGKSDTEDERISVLELLKDVEGLIQHFGSSTIAVQVNCEDKLPALSGQRSMLLDMLLNLGLNACDAMEEHGDLLKFEAIQRSISGEDGQHRQHICIRVVDNGCGMTEEQVKSIFNEFYTTKEHGAGLGLWMVHEAVRAFNGTVEVYSQPGQGSTFEIRLPVPDGQTVEEEVEAIAEVETRVVIEELDFAVGKRLLFIEDEPLLRNGVQTWLETMGFDVFVAADGAEGLELFKRHADELDLIIQDFILPGIRGEVLLENFKAEKPDLPVIVCSGYPDGRDYAWIKEKGAYAFLPKPFRIEKLISILNEIFQG